MSSSNKQPGHISCLLLWQCNRGNVLCSTLHMRMQVTVLSSGEKLEAFLERCGGGDGKAKKSAKSGAAWGGCVLLFSDKKQTSPLYKSLAAQYAGKLAFGEVRITTQLCRSLHESSISLAGRTFGTAEQQGLTAVMLCSCSKPCAYQCTVAT